MWVVGKVQVEGGEGRGWSFPLLYPVFFAIDCHIQQPGKKRRKKETPYLCEGVVVSNKGFTGGRSCPFSIHG